MKKLKQKAKRIRKKVRRHPKPEKIYYTALIWFFGFLFILSLFAWFDSESSENASSDQENEIVGHYESS